MAPQCWRRLVPRPVLPLPSAGVKSGQVCVSGQLPAVGLEVACRPRESQGAGSGGGRARAAADELRHAAGLAWEPVRQGGVGCGGPKTRAAGGVGELRWGPKTLPPSQPCWGTRPGRLGGREGRVPPRSVLPKELTDAAACPPEAGGAASPRGRPGGRRGWRWTRRWAWVSMRLCTAAPECRPARPSAPAPQASRPRRGCPASPSTSRRPPAPRAWGQAR